MSTSVETQIEVRIEQTPNPATLKFQFNRAIAPKTADFTNAQATEGSPLAAKLFGFPWTSAVFIGPDFVTVTKQDWVDWEVLAEPLSGLIKEHLQDGLPVLIEILDQGSSDDILESDSEMVRQIKKALARDIRPVVALDGGDIVFANYDNNVLAIKMKGACAGCPSSQATLKEGIEVRMKELFPEIKAVIAV